MFSEKDRPRFTINGDLGTFQAFITFKEAFFGKKTTDAEAKKKIEFWSKKGNLGIIPKMAVKRGDLLGLNTIINEERMGK